MKISNLRKKPDPRPPAPGPQMKGFSLIEFMVTVTVSVLIISASFSLFQKSLASHDLSQNTVDLQQNIRTSLNLLTRDFLVAGAEITIGGIPVPTSFMPGGMLYPIMPGYRRGPTINGVATDRVTIVYGQFALQNLESDSSLTYQVNRIAPSGGQIQLDVSGSNPDASSIQKDDVLLIKTAVGGLSALGYVTGKDARSNTISFAVGDPLGLNASGATSPVGNLSCQNHGGSASCVDIATAFKVNIVQFFIDVSTGEPLLMRRLNGAEPTPLGTEIENLQITYVLGDATTSGDPANPPDIRKANIFLLGRSKTRGQDQAFYRFPLGTQVATRNLAYTARSR